MHILNKVEKQKLQRLICQSLCSLCEAGLPDSTNISIEGLIGITVNSEFVILVGVQEEIGDSEVEMIESLGEPSHGIAGGGKGTYYQDYHTKMFQQTHAAVLRQQLMQAMHHASMAAAQSMPPSEKSLQQFSKAPQQHDKTSFKYPFDGSDDEEIPKQNQTFMLTSSPSKTIPSTSTEGKDEFPFSNYDRGKFEANRDKVQREEAEVAVTADTGTKTPNKPLAVSPPEQVQASTICITAVVDSPKIDECATNTKPQSPVSQIAVQIASVPDYGRRLGTLTAVKQEGASRRRIRRNSKVHQHRESNVQIEEISDGDNTMQDDGVTSDSMMAGTVATSPGGGSGSHPVSPHDGIGGAGQSSMDEQQIPTDAIMEIDSLSQMDAEEQRPDFVDLGNSLLQILPVMVEKGGDGPAIHEIVEIDDYDEGKGEPRENRDMSLSSGANNHGPVHLQVLMELQKKIAAEINTKTNKVTPAVSETLNTTPLPQESPGEELLADIDEYEGFVPPPFPPFMGRGFGPRGCGFGGHDGFRHHFCERRGGFGGRGGVFGHGGIFGRGGHMMGFCPPFFGEKKLWSCIICAASFNSKINFESHMLKHENKGQCDAGLDESVGMSCPYCKKRFRYKSWLEQHITSHTKEKLFHCPYCSKAYTRRRNVRNHIQMFHPEVLMGQIIDTEDSLGAVKQQEVETPDLQN